MILYHYSRAKVEELDDRPAEHYRDYYDNPGGLWLSLAKASNEGWYSLARGMIQRGLSWPCNNCIKYTTIFEIVDPSSERILKIANVDELDDFVNCYREQTPRRCREPISGQDRPHPSEKCDRTLLRECFNCVGIHIDWTSVKTEFDGISIIPYLEQQSYKHKESQYHWYRFDCAAACFWRPTAHLVKVGQSALNQELRIIGPGCSDCIRARFPLPGP